MHINKEASDLLQKIEKIESVDFNELALEIFHFQYKYNTVYQKYVDARNINPSAVSSIGKIPFLPISAFKTQQIKTGEFEPEIIFESSGTTGDTSSKHYVRSLTLYEQSFIKSFTKIYGDVSSYAILCLLPSYLERGNSSLVYMADKLMKISAHPHNGFFLYNFDDLALKIKTLESNQTKTLLIGVAYALLDFGALHPTALKHTTIMETGGMKGRKKEISKAELHKELSSHFSLSEIHAEYGMTELLSQAYSVGDGIFEPGYGMQIQIRQDDDPTQLQSFETSNDVALTGGVNIIDLHNLFSCSFIATDDLGKLYPNGNFEILGRIQNSDIRGCGLMYTNQFPE
jgi:hypothetical protein